MRVNVDILADLIDVYQRSIDSIEDKIKEIDAEARQCDYTPEGQFQRERLNFRRVMYERDAANDQGRLAAYRHCRQMLIQQIKGLENEESTEVDPFLTRDATGRN
jgi:hypothetical protein